MRFLYFILLISFFRISCWSEELSFTELHVDPFFEKAVDQKSQIILASGAFAVFLTNLNDDSTREAWKNHQKMSKEMSRAGDLLGSGALGVLSTGAQYFYDDDKDHWQSNARGLVWSTLFVTVLKYSFGRQRPGNSDSHLSFPSGHTTTAFATATSLTYAYGWEAAAIAYPIAVWVGLSRLSDDAHYESDVVAGAFLGFWAARASDYSTSSLKSETKQNVFFPVLGPDLNGVTWISSF